MSRVTSKTFQVTKLWEQADDDQRQYCLKYLHECLCRKLLVSKLKSLSARSNGHTKRLFIEIAILCLIFAAFKLTLSDYTVRGGRLLSSP